MCRTWLSYPYKYRFQNKTTNIKNNQNLHQTIPINKKFHSNTKTPQTLPSKQSTNYTLPTPNSFIRERWNIKNKKAYAQKKAKHARSTEASHLLFVRNKQTNKQTNIYSDVWRSWLRNESQLLFLVARLND